MTIKESLTNLFGVVAIGGIMAGLMAANDYRQEQFQNNEADIQDCLQQHFSEQDITQQELPRDIECGYDGDKTATVRLFKIYTHEASGDSYVSYVPKENRFLIFLEGRFCHILRICALMPCKSHLLIFSRLFYKARQAISLR